MGKRDYFEEIQALRIRNPQRKSAFDETLRRLEPLSKCTRQLANQKRLTHMQRELLRYAPVGAVACIEGYYKGVVRELIDLGTPYRENVVNLKEVKLTLESLVGLHDGKATLGEFISHFLGISNLEDIDYVMSAITGQEFLKQLKLDMDVPEKVFVGIKQAFELRHIVAHELAPNIRPSKEEAGDCVMYTFFLILATQRLIQNILLPSRENV